MNKCKIISVLIFVISIGFSLNTIQLYAMEREDAREVELVCKDSKFKIKRSIIIEYSNFIKDMLEEQDEEEEEVPIIPIPNVTAQDFRRINTLMIEAKKLKEKYNYRAQNSKQKDAIDQIIKLDLITQISGWKLSLEQIKNLFNAALYLNSPLILGALFFYLIDKDPKVGALGASADLYESYKDPRIKEKKWNPLLLNQNLFEAYRRIIEENIDNFIIVRSQRGFNKWFEQAKLIPTFSTYIGKIIWHFAQELPDETKVSLFHLITEENLLKMALRITYFLSTKELLDVIDVSKLHFKVVDNKNGWIKYIGKKFFKIDIRDFKDFNFGETGLDSYKIINMYLYLTGFMPIEFQLDEIQITLNNNRLTQVPDSLHYCDTYFANLVIVRLHKNPLENLPLFICELKKLRYLGIGGTNIHILPNCLKKMTRLESLWINKNMVKPNVELLNSLDKKGVDIGWPWGTSYNKYKWWKKRNENIVFARSIINSLRDRYSDQILKTLQMGMEAGGLLSNPTFTKEEIENAIRNKAKELYEGSQKQEYKSRIIVDDPEKRFRGMIYNISGTTVYVYTPSGNQIMCLVNQNIIDRGNIQVGTTVTGVLIERTDRNKWFGRI